MYTFYKCIDSYFCNSVVVKRPPSAAQCRAYHATPRGPPVLPKEKRARPSSAKARLSTEHDAQNTPAAGVPPRPPWRPFTREYSLSKLDTTGFLDVQQSEEMGVKMKREEEEEEKEKKKIPSIYQNRLVYASWYIFRGLSLILVVHGGGVGIITMDDC